MFRFGRHELLGHDAPLPLASKPVRSSGGQPKPRNEAPVPCAQPGVTQASIYGYRKHRVGWDGEWGRDLLVGLGLLRWTPWGLAWACVATFYFARHRVSHTRWP